MDENSAAGSDGIPAILLKIKNSISLVLIEKVYKTNEKLNLNI